MRRGVRAWGEGKRHKKEGTLRLPKAAQRGMPLLRGCGDEGVGEASESALVRARAKQNSRCEAFVRPHRAKGGSEGGKGGWGAAPRQGGARFYLPARRGG